MKHLCLICILLNSFLYGQGDSLMVTSYELVKITEYRKEVKISPQWKELSFIIIDDQKKLDLYKQRYRLNASMNDTIVTMDWDIEKDAGLKGKLPDAGLYKFNRTNNSVVIKKSRLTNENKRVIVERKFKIFKWNTAVLILQDITDPDIDRVYSFKGLKQ
jgi:hypothetical protein